MKKVSVAILGLLFGSSLANAADMPDILPVYAPSWSWTGFYAGIHLGANSASSQFADPAGPPIYGGTVRSPAFLGGGQAGYNWQVPNSSFVLGVEGDVSGYVSDGSATCLASSGFFISANCRVHQGLGGNLTGRVGWAAGAQGRTLLYAKGGLAVLQERIDITSNPLVFPRQALTARDGDGPSVPASNGRSRRPGHSSWNTITRNSAPSTSPRRKASSRSCRRSTTVIFKRLAARPRSARTCTPSK